MIEDTCLDDLDRSFLNLSSTMADFFSWTYGMLGYRLIAPLDPNKFDNATSKVKEIGIRALIVLGAALSFCFAGTYLLLGAVILGVGSKIFRVLGFHFQKDGFTHVRGLAPETALAREQATVMIWDIRGYGGGLHYSHGVVHWRSRMDQIVDPIRAENPDVVVLQEVYDTALMETLIDRLKDRYAHFYIHLGPNPCGSESGCMIITKCAVHNFSYTEFSNLEDETVNRGFATFEIEASPTDSLPCARIIGTQLTPGKEWEERRVEQIAQIVNALAKQTLALPTLFVGNLSIDRDREGDLLSKYLYHSYLDKEPTHSDQLANQWAPIYEGQEESSDFISFFKRSLPDGRILPVIEKDIRLIDSHLVRGFDDNYNTKTAASDHHAVVTTVSGLREALIR